MGLNVSDGDAFIFINRQLDSMKILHMEDGGLVMHDATKRIHPFSHICLSRTEIVTHGVIQAKHTGQGFGTGRYVLNEGR